MHADLELVLWRCYLSPLSALRCAYGLLKPFFPLYRLRLRYADEPAVNSAALITLCSRPLEAVSTVQAAAAVRGRAGGELCRADNVVLKTS